MSASLPLQSVGVLPASQFLAVHAGGPPSNVIYGVSPNKVELPKLLEANTYAHSSKKTCPNIEITSQ
ncbi:hypothetical protein IAD21_04450 [Abditibacteriota bacterium]|nr:hypothetical protein IAD21_04450 [Abditibacteriota bacterium]